MFKIGDKVVFAGGDSSTLTYGYTDSMASFVFDGIEGVIQHISDDDDTKCLSVDTNSDWSYSYAEKELKLASKVVQAEPAQRVKYLYSVQTADGETHITATQDREFAREVKAHLGGKKEGIVIMAYAPVKEIR